MFVRILVSSFTIYDDMIWFECLNFDNIRQFLLNQNLTVVTISHTYYNDCGSKVHSWSSFAHTLRVLINDTCAALVIIPITIHRVIISLTKNNCAAISSCMESATWCPKAAMTKIAKTENCMDCSCSALWVKDCMDAKNCTWPMVGCDWGVMHVKPHLYMLSIHVM